LLVFILPPRRRILDRAALHCAIDEIAAAGGARLTVERPEPLPPGWNPQPFVTD